MSGKVYLGGAGPGDIRLTTLGVVSLLETVDVVLYDQLVNASLLKYCRDDAECINVGKTGVGKDKRKTKQDEINQLMIGFAKEGKTVLRLKGGDPFIFGRGSEECEVLAEADVPFEVLPGVSSAVAVAAYAGIPLTHRELSRSVSFATGHLMEGASSEEIVIPRTDTIVFLMGLKNLEVLQQKLLLEGHDPAKPCALIEQGTTSRQRTFLATLESIVQVRDANQVKPPALFIVGEVVKLREKIAWFEKKPLFGYNLVITRAMKQAGELANRLRELGADVFECPTIAIQKKEKAKAWFQQKEALGSHTDVLFTSENGVHLFFEFLLEAGLDARNLAGKKFYAIGPKTAKVMEQHGVCADFLPERYQAEGLLDLLEKDLSGRSFLLPRAAGSREILPDEIRSRGGGLEELCLYESVLPKEKRPLPETIDGLCFTSASTVRHYAELYSISGDEQVFAIGEITAASAKEAGFQKIAVAEKATLDHLIQIILQKLDLSSKY